MNIFKVWHKEGAKMAVYPSPGAVVGDVSTAVGKYVAIQFTSPLTFNISPYDVIFNWVSNISATAKTAYDDKTQTFPIFLIKYDFENNIGYFGSVLGMPKLETYNKTRGATNLGTIIPELINTPAQLLLRDLNTFHGNTTSVSLYPFDNTRYFAPNDYQTFNTHDILLEIAHSYNAIWQENFTTFVNGKLEMVVNNDFGARSYDDRLYLKLSEMTTYETENEVKTTLDTYNVIVMINSSDSSVILYAYLDINNTVKFVNNVYDVRTPYAVRYNILSQDDGNVQEAQARAKYALSNSSNVPYSNVSILTDWREGWTVGQRVIWIESNTQAFIRQIDFKNKRCTIGVSDVIQLSDSWLQS